MEKEFEIISISNPGEPRIRFGDRALKNFAEICVMGLSFASFYKLSCRINIASSCTWLCAARAMKKEGKKKKSRSSRGLREEVCRQRDFLARRRGNEDEQ